MSEPMTASRPITLTIVCDNYSLDAHLTLAWGFASLIQAGETTILFDTGGDEQVLMHNLAALDFDLCQIDTIVLSHLHLDHIGLAKTHLQHILIAAAMNLMRVAHWLAEEPLAQARSSAFVRLHQPAAA